MKHISALWVLLALFVYVFIFKTKAKYIFLSNWVIFMSITMKNVADQSDTTAANVNKYIYFFFEKFE